MKLDGVRRDNGTMSSHTGRPSTRRSSLPRYDLRRRVLVSNLSRNIQPSSLNATATLSPLPSKPNSAPLDLIKDLPNGSSIGKRAKMNCISSHPAITPEKKESKFRIDPSVLRNPIIHTPVKVTEKTSPKRRRSDTSSRDTMSIHLLREDYVPPAKKDRLDASARASTVFTNTAIVEPFREDAGEKRPAKPVPMPRKSKMSSSSSDGRPDSADSSVASSGSDPIYARIEDCTTGNRVDAAKCGAVASAALRTDVRVDAVVKNCTDGRKRNSLPHEENRSRLRPRFSSVSSGECRARKSLLFSDGVDTSKAQPGLTLRNIYAAESQSESLLKDTQNRVSSPDGGGVRQPRIVNQSGIYQNNTLVVDSTTLKKDEVDKSYGFACRMRPMLRALSERKVPYPLLPNKSAKCETNMDTPLKGGNIDKAPPLPPPRPAKVPSKTPSPKIQVESNRLKNNQNYSPVTPNREVAIQTSFLIHGADDCPLTMKETSAKKRRRSMEIIAEVGAKVKRKGSILRDKLRRSLELTPGKAVS